MSVALPRNDLLAKKWYFGEARTIWQQKTDVKKFIERKHFSCTTMFSALYPHDYELNSKIYKIGQYQNVLIIQGPCLDHIMD